MHHKPIEATAPKRLDDSSQSRTDRETTPDTQGLSHAEVERRRAAGQGNAAPLGTTRSYAQILRENVFTFINNVLFGLGITLILLGRVSDALVSVGVVLANMLVGVTQEIRAKRMLDRVALLTRPKATVMREGRELAIDPDDLVLGDILVARPGDQIVVDGEILGEGRMQVDESLLTGESDLISKQSGDKVYSGSFCVAGSAHYQAQVVGSEKLAHRIASQARAFRRIYTPLQQHVNLVVRVILLIVVYFELLLIVDAALKHLPVVETIRMSVVIAGLVPNGLFLAIATAYALGAVRMVGQGALVQQSNAVESLSNVDVLCMDKTGTLTANRLKLESVRPFGVSEADVRRLLGDYCASTPAANRTTDALREALGGNVRPIAEHIPFSSAYKWSAISFSDESSAGDGARGTYLLGAPEILAQRTSPEDAGMWNSLADEWAGRGQRVLLFAQAPASASLQIGENPPQAPDRLRVLGLIGLSDELRPAVRETLDAFASAGLTLKVISGDNPDTVAALARQVGLDGAGLSLSGLGLQTDDPVQVAQAAEDHTIFGRITPGQKEALVAGLRSRGHYVAIIGDGVNDVLALKRANLGIAMESGSQATRSVADIVLLNDTFAALPYAFREGQRIINGMQDILKLFLTRVLYAALLILSTAVVGGFPFSPKHNGLLTLLTVGIPSLALAAWARPGLRADKRFIRPLMRFVLPPTLTVAPLALGVYVYYLFTRAPDLNDAVALMQNTVPLAQSALTTFLIFCGLLLVPFAEPPTQAFVGGDELAGDWRPTQLALILLGLYLVVLATPPLRNFFDLVPMPLGEYGALAALAIAWAILLRWVWRARILERFLDVDL